MLDEENGEELSADHEERAFRLATTLAPMLFAAAAFALSVASATQNPNSTIIDELLSLLAAICVISATLIIDAILHGIKLTFVKRITFLGGG